MFYIVPEQYSNYNMITHVCWTGCSDIEGTEDQPIFPILKDLTQSGSCCWIAFLTKLYIGAARLSNCPAHLINVALLNDSFDRFYNFPWISNNDIHLKFVSICFSFKIFRADERSLLLEIMESMFIFLADVLSQICRDSSFFENFCFTRWLSLKVSAVSFNDFIPNPPWFLGSDNISDTHVLIGNSNQSLTALEIRISNFWVIHVYDISYIS